jgi:hypothetical protein
MENSKIYLGFYKCPITAPKIRTLSQLLSEFSYNTSKLLNVGHPRFWPSSPEMAKILLWGVCGWGGGGLKMRREQLPPLSHLDGGEGGKGGGGLATVCTPHICSPLSRSSFSFLHSVVKASFDIKKACGKPYIHILLR